MLDEIRHSLNGEFVPSQIRCSYVRSGFSDRREFQQSRGGDGEGVGGRGYQ